MECCAYDIWLSIKIQCNKTTSSLNQDLTENKEKKNEKNNFPSLSRSLSWFGSKGSCWHVLDICIFLMFHPNIGK